MMGEFEIQRAVKSVMDVKDWPCQCHAASHKLVTSGKLGPCRVARGACTGVAAQHSWVILGNDCYDESATIVDPTLWSYDESVDGLWIGTYKDGRHTPHGKGNIFAWGRPESPVGPVVELEPPAPLSRAAQSFLEMLGPLDRQGWATLAHAPVQGWPAGEILAAMHNTPQLTAYVPIDILGMVTDINPGGIYR